MRLIRNDINIPIMQNRKVFYIISSVLIVASLISVAVHGINFGIDFNGGYELQVKFPTAVDVSRVKQALRTLKLGEPVVQQFGDEGRHEYLIRIRRTRAVDTTILAAVKADLVKAAGEGNSVEMHPSESGERITVEFTTAIEQAQLEAAFTSKGLVVHEIIEDKRGKKPTFAVVLPPVSERVEALLRKEFNLPKPTTTAAVAPTPAAPTDAGSDAVAAAPVADAGSDAAVAMAAPAAPTPTIGKTDELMGRVEYVGPQVGKQLRNQGMLAIGYALLFILIYIAIRFDFFFSPGAVVALAHDVIITIGIFSIFGIEFNLPIIAALLTIVGYSLNDTIVVYDRVRENLVKLRGRDLTALVNTSINETLSRTLLTSVTTLLVVVMLLVFGGGIIRDFSLALLIGVVVGTYSSVAVASPVYLALRDRFGKTKATA